MTNIPCEQKIIYKCTIILDFYYVTITIAKFHTKKSKITIKCINYSNFINMPIDFDLDFNQFHVCNKFSFSSFIDSSYVYGKYV